jgi:predicted MFS family arabinose efflux permease
MLTGVFVTADRVAPPGTAAEAFAWVATAFLLGSAAGSALDGALLEAGGRLAAGFLIAPLAILAASAVLGVAARRTPSPSPPLPPRGSPRPRTRRSARGAG